MEEKRCTLMPFNIMAVAANSANLKMRACNMGCFIGADKHVLVKLSMKSIPLRVVSGIVANHDTILNKL